MADAFHEVRFPLAVGLSGSGGPERRTDVVITGSGREERNARWAHSRRRYDAGSGLRTLAELAEVIAFFEERRGRLTGFRFRDRADWKSCGPDGTISPTDQRIGTGDGTLRDFDLCKTYGTGFAPYRRPIAKPVAGSVRIAVAGVEADARDFTVDPARGRVTFVAGKAPRAGAAVTAGFAFDVPVRFDADEIFVDYEAFTAGAIPKIPLVEIII